jgi:hypothetical protein
MGAPAQVVVQADLVAAGAEAREALAAAVGVAAADL